MPARLRPTAPIAPDAILVGDPGRALMLAQELLQQPKMSNHARGLWGYSGRTEAGDELTIQSTGMGGPSATVVLNDLAELGVRRAIRIGTCTALDNQQTGELVIATSALAHPSRGSFRSPGDRKEPQDQWSRPDRPLTEALESCLEDAVLHCGVVSLDTLHRPGVEERPHVGEVADMQTAALLVRGEELGVAIAALLVVAHAEGDDLSDEGLEEAAKRAGRAAVAALSL